MEVYVVLVHITAIRSAVVMLLVCFHALTACVAKSIQRPRLFPAFSRRLDGLSYTRGTRPLSQYLRLSGSCCRRSGADIPRFSRGVSLRGVEYLNKVLSYFF